MTADHTPPPATTAADTGTGRIVVISDIHGNAAAYAASLAQARNRGFDRLILLGDLLTYGCEPLQVLDLTRQALTRDDALLIKGNHDQLYFDLRRGEHAYYDGLPDWLRETVDWTMEALDGLDLEAAFPWLDHYEHHDTLFAHANPFAYGDWSYLDDPASLVHAARALGERGRAIGVFGHTHRRKGAAVDATGDCRLLSATADGRPVRIPLGGGRTVLLNPGSIGQPRDQERLSTMLAVAYAADALDVTFAPVRYDVPAHKRAILKASLSAATTAKLLGFFR